MARPSKDTLPPASGLDRRLREAAALLLLPLVVWLMVCLVSFDLRDPGWGQSAPVAAVRNIGGLVGAWTASTGLYFIGIAAFLLPALLLFGGWRLLRGSDDDDALKVDPPVRLVGSVALLASAARSSGARSSARR